MVGFAFLAKWGLRTAVKVDDVLWISTLGIFATSVVLLGCLNGETAGSVFGFQGAKGSRAVLNLVALAALGGCAFSVHSFYDRWSYIRGLAESRRSPEAKRTPTISPPTKPNVAFSQSGNANDDLIDSLSLQSQNRLLTCTELRSIPLGKLRLLRNAVFARHGYAFDSADLRDYFTQKGWYRGTSNNAAAAESTFSSTEKESIDNIKIVEKEARDGLDSLKRLADRNALERQRATTPNNASDSYPGEHFPMTRLRILDESDCASWQYKDVRYAINEIFARHGGTFRTDYIQQEFERQSWYRPVHGRSVQNMDSFLTEIERANVKLLGARRKELERLGAN